jgi:hypothetical protein
MGEHKSQVYVKKVLRKIFEPDSKNKKFFFYLCISRSIVRILQDMLRRVW